MVDLAKDLKGEEMRKMSLLCAVFASAAVLLAADLQPLNVKPGLWQVTMTSTISGLAPNTSTYKSCVKKEDLDKYPFADPKAKCTWTVQNSTGSKMDASGTCMPDNDTRINFTMHLEALDSENAKGTGQLTLKAPIGTMNGNYSGTGKWMGATCPAGVK
jgi:hypothetical protein